MILKRFYDDGLAHASWMVGCAATGEALVVDPGRDVEPYLAAAEDEGLRVTHVTETHIHADFVSGSRELAARAGAKLFLSDEGDENWKYAWAGDAGATLLNDGDSFMVGNVRVEAMHTPGHTPEHLAFVVTDTAGADRPMGVFTGDFLFVGDVGRPDLLERAAHYAGTMEAGARTLFRSLRRFREALPDWVQIWPAHGAGSACGKALGAVPQSTLGYEALFNWGLATEDEGEFVRAVLAGQPEPPMYFAEMKRINRDGPPLLGGTERAPRLGASRLGEVLEAGGVVIDLRAADAYRRGHVPGTLSVPFGGSFATWAGSVLAYGEPIHLILPDDDHETAERAVRALLSIGLDDVAGWFAPGAVEAWSEANGGLEATDEVEPGALEAHRSDGAELVDVRNATEWEAGHVPGSVNAPVGRLREQLGELPRDRELVVHCLSGARATVAIGLLRAEGFPHVSHLVGDFEDWRDDGRPVEKEESAETAAAA